MEINLDKIQLGEEPAKTSSLFQPLTSEATQLQLVRHKEQALYNLGFAPGRNIPTTNTQLVAGTFHTATDNTPLPAGGGDRHLTREQFMAYLAKAAPLARTGKWANMPDYTGIQAAAMLSFRESDWNPWAKPWSKKLQKYLSSAFGLFQFLDATWADYGVSKQVGTPTNLQDERAIVEQIIGGLRYCYGRYGGVEEAWAFWQATWNKDPSKLTPELHRKYNTWMQQPGQPSGY